MYIRTRTDGGFGGLAGIWGRGNLPPIKVGQISLPARRDWWSDTPSQGRINRENRYWASLLELGKIPHPAFSIERSS